MSTEQNIRLELLKQHCVRLGLVKDDDPKVPSPSKLGERIDRKTNYCSDLLLGRRSFGEDIARHIEDKLRLGRWALDGGAGWPFPGIDRRRFDELPPDRRTEIQGVVRERIERFEGGAKVGSQIATAEPIDAVGRQFLQEINKLDDRDLAGRAEQRALRAMRAYILSGGKDPEPEQPEAPLRPAKRTTPKPSRSR